jgi:hypothetical protein
MLAIGNNMDQMGKRSTNATLQPLGLFCAQYTRAYVAALLWTSQTTVSYLSNTAALAGAAISEACQAEALAMGMGSPGGEYAAQMITS